MKVEYINPFIKASTSVLNTLTQKEFSTGKPYIKDSPFDSSDVIILLGITGEVRGQAMIILSEQIARGIASAMMMGMPVESLDDMAKSALSEMGNMIMGNSATLLFNDGITVDITPPTLMVGKNVLISSHDMRTISIPITSELGTIEFDISLKE